MAISLKLAAPPSDEEILELSERNPGYQFERTTSGELIVTPTGSAGGRRDLLVSTQLHNWAEADGSGLAFGASAGFHLPDGSLLSPDASWVTLERWEALTPKQQEDFAPLCPDAVFEVRSRTDSVSGLRKKLEVYLVNGARLAVLIDPERRAVEIFAPNHSPEVLESARSVSCDPVLPGFTLDLEPIFS